MLDYIHNDIEFKELLDIVSAKMEIDITLIEKDYWIMHALFSLQQQGIDFELKGGTSLSKGFGLINRFSEDIDIHIRTNFGLSVEGKDDKVQVKNARKEFYDVLAQNISIDGIIRVERDFEFDDLEKYRSGGIRLYYQSYTPALNGLKDGILLEAGFDNVTPNTPLIISSWVWDHLISIGLHEKYINNTAKNICCYHPGYTFVEKIQTIIRKFRNLGKHIQSTDKNFIRQYYDVYCLLGNEDIINFISTPEYAAHKALRIKGADKKIPISDHPAFLMNDPEIMKSFKAKYQSTAKLYYKSQPEFEEILNRIHKYLPFL